MQDIFLFHTIVENLSGENDTNKKNEGEGGGGRDRERKGKGYD